MPFDSADTTSKTELFRKRREDAAEFWRSLPVDTFDLDKWTTCALGWLGIKQHDGWSWPTDRKVSYYSPMNPSGIHGFEGAMNYFGLSNDDALSCFYGTLVTPTDVATKLCSLPYKN